VSHDGRTMYLSEGNRLFAAAAIGFEKLIEERYA
jgi:hypothetical protein